MIDPQRIIQGLVQRGVPAPAAVGLAGNIGIESRYDPGINEINPIVPGSRGGFGLIQWTGPRRRQFEAYAGGKLDDLDTQLDFIVHELNTTEKSARDKIYSAGSAEEAARLVSTKFLRPGIPHLDKRVAETRKLMAMGGTEASPERQAMQPAPQPPQMTPFAPVARPEREQEPQNALAAQPKAPVWRNSLKAGDFVRQRQPVNFLSRRGTA